MKLICDMDKQTIFDDVSKRDCIKEIFRLKQVVINLSAKLGKIRIEKESNKGPFSDAMDNFRGFGKGW